MREERNSSWFAVSVARLLTALVVVSVTTSTLAAPSAFQLDPAFTSSPQFHQKVWPARVTAGASGKVYVTFVNGGVLGGLNNQRAGGVIRLNADGTLDRSFNVGTQLGGSWALIEQPNGKVLVGAQDSNESFDSGPGLYRVFRLNADGTRDSSYRSPVFAATPRYMTQQPDGKLLVVVQNNGFVNNGGLDGLQRLNSDGSLDTNFVSPAIDGIFFSNIVVDAAGRILAGGNFTTISGQSRPGIARLLSNGTLDTTFAPSGMSNRDGAGTVRGIGIQTSGANAGKIVIAGPNLYTAAGTRYPIFRFNTDGSLDTGFTLVSGTAVFRSPRMLSILSDDRILIVDAGLARFDANGSVDTTYNQPVFSIDTAYSQWVFTAETFWMDALADGRAYVPISAGLTVNANPAVQQIMRFNADGTADGSFAPGVFQRENYPEDVAVFPDGGFLAWGDFNTVGSVARAGAARFGPDGSLDSSYAITGIPNLLGITKAGVSSDGRLLALAMTGSDPITGSITALARFSPDGAADSSFKPDTAVSSRATGLQVLPDGRAIVWTSSVPEELINGSALFFKRLNLDGSLDNTFSGLSGANAQFGTVYRNAQNAVTSVTLGAFSIIGRYADGRLIAAATQGPYPANAANFNFTLLRLDADGTLDSTFSAPTATWPSVQVLDFSSAAADPSGQYLVTYIGFTGLGSPFSGVLPQADGSVIVYGSFTSLGGQAAGIARLTNSGALDATFSVGAGPEWRSAPGRSARIKHVALDASGKYWASGQFDTFAGQNTPGLARLNSDGSVDSGFSFPIIYSSYTGSSTRVVFDAAGRPIVLGAYQPSADGFPDAIHRLITAPIIGNPTQPVTPPIATQTAYTVSTGAMPAAAVAVTASGTLGSATVAVELDLSKGLSASFAADPAYNVYVAALVPGRQLGTTGNFWFVNAAKVGWQALVSPIASYLQNVAVGSADQRVLIEIIRDTNISTLIGTEIYVGYGTSDTEMLNAGRYRGVYIVQSEP
jgi:uncharacterized delta-60 repeat protein